MNVNILCQYLYIKLQILSIGDILLLNWSDPFNQLISLLLFFTFTSRNSHQWATTWSWTVVLDNFCRFTRCRGEWYLSVYVIYLLNKMWRRPFMIICSIYSCVSQMSVISEWGKKYFKYISCCYNDKNWKFIRRLTWAPKKVKTKQRTCTCRSKMSVYM